MPKPLTYGVVLSEGAADFILGLSKRRQRQVIKLARQLAHNPFLASDYALAGESGREINYLLMEDFVFAYWIDHAVSELRVVEIDDAS